MPEPTIPDPQPAPAPVCPRCSAKVSATDEFCVRCGFELTRPVQPPGPLVTLPPELPLKPGTAKLMNMMRRIMRRLPEKGAPKTTPSGEHRALTDMDKDELKALAKVLEAKRSPVDRWITLGLIPLMLLVAGPAVTYYFATRADQQQAAVQRTNDEVARLSETTDKLETLVIDAGKRVKKMDEARAVELTALRVIVQRLENALRLVVLRDAVQQAALTYAALDKPGMAGGAGRRPPAMMTALRKHRGAIVEQVQRQAQEQFPDMCEPEAKREVERVYDRYMEQVQAQTD